MQIATDHIACASCADNNSQRRSVHKLLYGDFSNTITNYEYLLLFIKAVVPKTRSHGVNWH